MILCRKNSFGHRINCTQTKKKENIIIFTRVKTMRCTWGCQTTICFFSHAKHIEIAKYLPCVVSFRIKVNWLFIKFKVKDIICIRTLAFLRQFNFYASYERVKYYNLKMLVSRISKSITGQIHSNIKSNNTMLELCGTQIFQCCAWVIKWKKNSALTCS